MQELFEKMGLFYLGKDSKEDELTLYKSKHLTTHAAIVGMTGSGKTGLGIGLIEEAALDNIPAIVIDPKGDMSNLALAFPDMKEEDFKPWIDPQDAASKGVSVEELAQSTASMWEEGIGKFGQDRARVERFAKVGKTIYTPGSSAGVGVDILGSFAAPNQEVLEESDTFSALINTTVSSLLALISIEADPISSREHLLLSNIFKHFWQKGESLSLEQLIGLVAAPPFEKIGVLPLSAFYPQPERMKLAMLFNSVISSVTFASWIEGEPLDIQNMLYDEEGKAKVAIFSIAHLGDEERMFFVSMLLGRFIDWMRSRRGSSSLKALLYMDEIFGFFPPVKNPPSKEPMLLLLKQARAFGVGVVLSTQNPGDIDYKGLSNIGTWFIGKLQSDQDIDKVIDGLAAKSSMDTKEIIESIRSLKGRHFFMRNVHTDSNEAFYTRWVLSYLKGPMTKDDIATLMSKRKEQVAVEQEQTQDRSNSGAPKPIISSKIEQYYNDTVLNADTPFYPYLVAHASVRFFNQKRAIDQEEELFLKLELYGEHPDWEEAILSEDFRVLPQQAQSTVRYGELPQYIREANDLKEQLKELSDHLYHEKRLELYGCKELKMESKAGMSERDFIVEVEDRIKELRDEKIEKLEEKYGGQKDRLDKRLRDAEMKLEKEKSDVAAKTTDTVISVGMTVLGALFGKKALSSSTISRGAGALRKGKGVLKERADVSRAESKIMDLSEDIEALEIKLEEAIIEIKEELDIDNYTIEPFYIKPRRSDVDVQSMALLWER
jgi:uncharacterized tellurite resistance protein B-like protein